MMDFHCEIKEQAAQPTLSIRKRTPIDGLPQLLGESYGKIAGYLAELGTQPDGAPFAAYYNMDMQDLDVEIGFPVTEPVPSKGDIQASQIPGGKLAIALHTGPYGEIGPAYDALTQFAKEQGCEPTGVSYEFYLNDPQETSPQDLKTQIIFPLK
ncbi:MAG: GyrI-like domain-containing protein [Anaerolineales bacterium]